MPRNDNWTSQQGLEAIKHVVSECIPSWRNGLRDWQLESISTILSRRNLFAIAATGDGKSALYTVPILAHLEIAKNPDTYPTFRFVSNPIVLVITPTKVLATSIIRELDTFGIPAFSYCHSNITEYRTVKKVNLEKLISECNTWNVICVDPEHLASPEWSSIIENDIFKSNLILFAVDEVHLVNSWGSSGFRPHFQLIGNFAQGCLPANVPIVALTATSPVGPETTAICDALGFLGDNYHLIRRSNERIKGEVVAWE
ncbi:hypothetical protein D9758_018977 [Tetrapyrgos nigripes]|uniref:Helicase ATP-binding domain-containing protein n=1 Tax=Tetrapyrgos nigripes TaxID=182062 RepID=A0A8H5BBD6_9AGAR|nr:hypothetical protein D9758_018977 [Tetrapyrgos nigripes]